MEHVILISLSSELIGTSSRLHQQDAGDDAVLKEICGGEPPKRKAVKKFAPPLIFLVG